MLCKCEIDHVMKTYYEKNVKYLISQVYLIKFWNYILDIYGYLKDIIKCLFEKCKFSLGE